MNISFETSADFIEYINRPRDRAFDCGQLNNIFNFVFANCTTDQALSLTSDIKSDKIKGYYLSDLSVKFTNENNIQEAVRIAALVNDIYIQSYAFAKVCWKLFDQNKYEEAIECTKNIRTKRYHESTLDGFVKKLFECN